jgi:acetyl esterase/lipase
VVAAIDFRQPPEHPYPASIADTNYGIRWLKARARDFNAVPESVGTLGTSSGGHVVVLSAMRPRDSRYAAIELPESPQVDATVVYTITCWGVLDPYTRYQMAKAQGNEGMLANHHRYWVTEDAQREGNPVQILERGETVELPPCLAIQGTADTGLPEGMLEHFVELYQKAGGDIELALFQDQPHGIAGWTEDAAQQMFERMKVFIARRLSQPAAVG